MIPCHMDSRKPASAAWPDFRPLTALIVFSVGLTFAAHAESRRAILVGINQYNPDASARSRLQTNAKAPAMARPRVEGDATYWRYENLDGALNDVRLMQAVLTDLGVTDFVVLTDQDATADAILSALQHNLVDDAQPGDVRVFYYSGHGNHIRNQASKEREGEDQTLVPADNWRNVPDIRDKEISRILWKAAQKGVKVTFIADSCHSGSLTRGAWNAQGKARSNSGRRGGTAGSAPKEPVANDSADVDPRTHEPIDPERDGVLTLAAAQSNEEAHETETEDGPHGAFTWALSHTLKYPNEPMERIFQKIAVQLHASGIAQQPVMGGMGRASKGLFGQVADAGAGLTILAESVSGKEIHLRGGTAIGLYPGCRLKSLSKPSVEVEITASDGIGASLAQVVGQGQAKTGDLFSVDRWTAPSSAALRVYIPKPAPAAAILKVAVEVGKLRNDPAIEWLDDPTAGRPTHVLNWNGSSWILELNPAAGAPADLGAAPGAAAVKRLLPAKARFLLLLPPTPELIAGIHLDGGENAMVATKPPGKAQSTPSGANYWFCGKWNGSDVEYAWVLPDATETSVRDLAGQTQKHPAGYLPLPLRSDWIKLGGTDTEIRNAGASLTEKALRLARIRAWLTLESPPAHNTFPYHLALQDVASGQIRESGDLREGEKFKLYLSAGAGAVKSSQGLEVRWIYVFAIDHFGKGSLIFPAPGRGNEGNHLPYAQVGEQPRFDPLIPLNGEKAEYDFDIGEPFGVDTYFLLTSLEPLDNPGVLEFDGLRTKGGTRGIGTLDPLTNLLTDLSSGTRAAHRPTTPATWSIESISFRSVPKKPE